MINFVYQGEPKKLSKILLKEYPDIGYSYLQKLFRRSDVKINGNRIKNDVIINSGDSVNIYTFDKETVSFKPEVVYEDDNLIVFIKPKKISSQGKNSFEEKVKDNIDKSYILCHRLDTNTEGLLIFAKSKDIFEEIKKCFVNNKIEKYYYALVYGDICAPGEYTDYIVKDSERSRVFVYSHDVSGCKKAILKYEPIEKKGESTLLSINLITGRTHQIRAQMAFHGHQVIGDGKYGKEDINGKFKMKTQQLVAYKIVFKEISGKLFYLSNKEIKIKDFKL